jgi:hypothetical protein
VPGHSPYGGSPYGGSATPPAEPPKPPGEETGGVSTGQIIPTSPEPRSIDPDTVWVRHIVRGAEGEPSAVTVARATFVRKDVVEGADGLGGREGWQAAEATLMLSDDDTFTLALANVTGDDGILHRRRFAILTDDDYEPGEEWIEFWRDPSELILVGTPTDYEKTRSQVVIKGSSLTGGVLNEVLSSDVDAWDAVAPVDVFRHYSRLPVLIYGADLAVPLSASGGEWGTPYSISFSGCQNDCFTIEARLRWVSAAPTAKGVSYVALNLLGWSIQTDLFDGSTQVFFPAEGFSPAFVVPGRALGIASPGPVSIRVVARYDHIFVFVGGELACDFRRTKPEPSETAPSGPWPAPTFAQVFVKEGTLNIDGLHVETLAPFAMRGASAAVDRALPGIPPATGLRGQYWGLGASWTSVSESWKVAPLAIEPVVDRVDPTVNFPITGGEKFPQALSGNYYVRYSGAIYLDLATADRQIKVGGIGLKRVYIGRTLRGEELIDRWQRPPESPFEYASGSLREWLGTSKSGWYPIVIEERGVIAPLVGHAILEDKPVGGVYAVVQQSRLSPLGCYGDLVKNTPHRQIIADVALAFGYQWRTEHRSLESGEFPGQLSFKALQGLVTNVVVDDTTTGTAAQVLGNAGDVVDGLVADAAGLADPKGSGQLGVQVVDYARANEHMALRQGYESLSEITEQPLLAVRADSILALRSSPNEQVGVRPRGQRDLVLPLSGPPAKFGWRPGDQVTLKLDSIDMVDQSPRQMSSVVWPLRPDGCGPPTVGFRQRPRTVRKAMERLQRAVYAPRRTYQGSLVVMPTDAGGSSTTAPIAGTDGYTRSALPGNKGKIVRGYLVIQVLEGSGWRMEIDGVDLGAEGALSSPGRYDILPWLISAGASAPLHLYARLIGGTSGLWYGSLEIHTLV